MFHKSAVISACVCLVLTINGAPATHTTTEVPIPAEIKVCVDLIIKCNNKEPFSHEKIDHICSAISNENGIGYIVTPEDVNYFLGLLNDMIRQNRRHKRQLRQRPIRREVRRMTSSQWQRFTRALRDLKRKVSLVDVYSLFAFSFIFPSDVCTIVRFKNHVGCKICNLTIKMNKKDICEIYTYVKIDNRCFYIYI